MENCDGPGIIALVSAARTMDGDPYIKASDSITKLDDVISEGLMPPDELELDCRGTLDVTRGKFAYVDIGEIKSKHKLGIGIVQLGIRLSVVAWLLGKCCQVANSDVRRVVASSFLEANIIVPHPVLNLQLMKNGATACMCTFFEAVTCMYVLSIAHCFVAWWRWLLNVVLSVCHLLA